MTDEHELLPGELRFSVPGRVITNNFAARIFHGRAVKNPKAILYQSRVASIALAAVRKSHWVFPNAVIVTITHWNGLVDVDNVAKSVLDGMKGIVFPDDRRRYVGGVLSRAAVDGGDEYVDVRVTPTEALPQIRVRKCSICLKSRPGVAIMPHICGDCAQRRKRAVA